MKRSVLIFALGVTGAAGCGGGNTTPTDSVPYRDDWKTEFEGPFPYLDAMGNPQILSISIGGTPYMSNFTNRGDIIVEFADTSTIKIEMRRFTMAADDQEAADDFKALELWSYNASGNPKKPADMDPADNCVKLDNNPWTDNCQIRVFYNGLDQLQRSGADLRVTIPQVYRYALDITTTDNDVDSDYHNRGDVCIQNLNASADVKMGSGRAYVTLSPDVTPVPTCSPADVMTCETFTDGDGNPQTWGPMCPCLAAGDNFGQFEIASDAPSATEMMVDIPTGLWTSMNLQNQGTSQLVEPPVDSCGQRCDATVSAPGFVIDDSIGDEMTRDPWHEKGAINYPGPPAINGAGYQITMTSAGCAPVSSTEDPAKFVGVDNGDMEHTEEHGNLEVCSGCLQGMSCDQLIASKAKQDGCG